MNFETAVESLKIFVYRITKRLVITCIVALFGFLLANYVFPGLNILENLPWDPLKMQWKGWIGLGFCLTILIDLFRPYWIDLALDKGVIIFESLLLAIFISIIVLV